MVQIHAGPPFLPGAVAQLGERGLCKPEVVGSIPISSTIPNLVLSDPFGVGSPVTGEAQFTAVDPWQLNSFLGPSGREFDLTP